MATMRYDASMSKSFERTGGTVLVCTVGAAALTGGFTDGPLVFVGAAVGGAFGLWSGLRERRREAAAAKD